MEIERNAGKRIVVLEVQCKKLYVEKTKLMEEVTEVKGKEEKTMGKYLKVKEKYGKVKEEIDSERRKWSEEVENIREGYRQVGVEKKKLEIDLKAAKQRIADRSVEEAEKLWAKDKHCQRLLEESNGKITTSLAKNEALEKHIRQLERDLEAQMAMEAKKHKVEEEKIVELVQKIQVLEREKGEIEAELSKMKEDNRSLEIDLEAQMAKDKHFKCLLEDSNSTVTTLLEKNEALERHNGRLEKDLEAQMAIEVKKHKVEEERVLELVQKIQVLEREKGETEAELSKMKEDNSNEAERNRVEKAMKKVNELAKTVGVLKRLKEAEKMAMEDEGKKKVSELTHRIEVLERQKSEEIKLILNEKMAVEAEKKTMEAESKKKVLELDQRIEVLERELETEVCRAKRERSEEIKNILNEKKVLEMEKQELEVETREKDERIEALVQEKECLESKGKEIVTNWCVVKSHEDVELPQRVHPARNIDSLSTLTAQNQGPESVDISVTEPSESSDGGMELMLLGSEIRKVEGLGSFVANQDGTKRCKLDGLTEHKLVLKNRRDMFNSFTVNAKLCMRSVCALYRKYKSLGDWKNCLISSSSNRGFIHPYETRGMDLGELLTSGDPEGRLKKSVAEFEEEDPRGLEDCRRIAWQHYKELFEIYKSNLDPLFILDDEMY